MKKILIIISLILSWDSAVAQCFSQAGELSTAVISPEFCASNGGTLAVDITYPATPPVSSDQYFTLIVDDLTQTILVGQGFGTVSSTSTVVVNIPGALIAGNYQIYGLNVDAGDADILTLYPGGVADIIGTPISSLITNIENLGGVSFTGDICGDITTVTVAFEVLALPTVTYTAPADLCLGAGVQAGLSGGSPAGGVYSGPGVTDDGNGMTYSFDPSLLLNTVYTLTYTFTNVSGCTNSSSDDIELFALPAVNFSAPADVCSDFSVLTGQGGGTPTGGVYSGSGVTDDGNGMTYSFDPVSAGVGTHLITYTFTDGNGCEANSSDNIQVGDVTVPTAVCQNINVYLDGAGTASIVATDLDGGSTDNCSAVTLSASQTSFNCGDVGPNNVTLTVTDAAANSSSCVAVVTVIDTISPTAVCQNITAYLDGSGTAIVFSADVDGGSTDNCLVAGTSSSPAIFNCSNVGANNVTFTVTDNSGNTASCTSIVTILDTVSPVTVCQNINAYLDASGNVNIVAADIDGGSTDNCATVTLSASQTSFDCGDIGANNVTLTSTDASGNTSSCVAVVTVIDTISPTAVCQNINAYLDGSGNVSIVAADLDGGSLDNCGGVTLSASQTAFTCSNTGGNSVTLTVTDAYGNTSSCMATVTVLDTISPVVTCPGNQTENPNAFCQFTLPDYTGLGFATDNCISSPTIVQSPGPGTLISGVTTITLTATDVDGNSGTCTFDVTLLDIVPPTAVCQNINVYLNGAGTASIVAADLDGGSTDNCGGVTLSASQTSFNCGDVGPNNVTLTVTDGASNSSNCIAVVTVIDTISPTAVCQNITAYLDGSGTAIVFSTDVDGGSTDNCGIGGLGSSPAVFNCSNVGPNNVTLTVTDVNGNSASCTSIVTILDTISPVVTCPGNQTESPNAFCQFTLPDYTGLGSATDNCGTPTITQSPSPGSVISGPTTITFTATDGAGNSSTCTFDVTLVDIVPPTAVCQNINVYLDGSGNASIVAADLDGGSTDNCGGVTLSASQTSFTCGDVGPNSVTLTVTDGATNSSNCIAVVTVLDTISPVVTCPGNQLESPNAFCQFTLPDYTGLGLATDNCTSSPTIVQSPGPGTLISGATTITFTTTDGNGNSGMCTFDVTLIDVVAPTAVCQNINVYLDGTGNATIVAGDIDAGSSDNCAGLMLSASQTSFDCGDVGPNNVTLTATDGASNSASCTAIVTVLDTVSPVASCQNITAFLDGSGNATITGADIDAGSSDNCGGVTLSASQTSFTCADIGSNTVTLTVTDGNGNTSTCTSTVTITDAIDPVAVCQNISIQLDGTLNASIVAADIDGGSTDNCGVVSLAASQTNFTCADIGANNVTLTVTDGSGNTATCVAVVTVTENVAPTASNPADLNVECVGDIPAPNGSVVTDAMDNCGSPVVTWVDDVSDGNSCPETIIRTYNVADASGNNIDVTQTITVMDVTAPTASNPGDITVQCIANFPTPNVGVVTDEADNCGTPTVTFISDVTDGLSCPETFTRTYRITDDCGNSIDVQQLIMVNDISAPVPDVATLPTETFSCETTPTPPTATDNCVGTVVGVSDLVLPITTFGASTITWTYTDNCGNVTTQTQDVNILAMDVSTFVATDGITIVANNTGGTYQWIDCGTNQPIVGETGPSYTATYNGSFAVEITKGNCFDMSACTTISTVGISDIVDTKPVEVYPNPTSGTVTISSGSTFNKIEVLNTLGQKVAEYKISETSKYSLTLPEENGVYLIKIYNNESMTIKRVVKK